MSAYSEWKCGAIDKSEYESICRREEGMDKAREERMLYEDACYERCMQCEMFDETGECSIGETATRCSCYN